MTPNFEQALLDLELKLQKDGVDREEMISAYELRLMALRELEDEDAAAESSNGED